MDGQELAAAADHAADHAAPMATICATGILQSVLNQLSGGTSTGWDKPARVPHSVISCALPDGVVLLTGPWPIRRGSRWAPPAACFKAGPRVGANMASGGSQGSVQIHASRA